MSVGQSVPRVDAYDKVTGRAKYTDDLVDKCTLVGKVLHATITNGIVVSMDTSEAEKVEGVVKIVTCFDVPQLPFPSAGHPWSTDPDHRDVADKLLLTRRVRLYGDDIAAVIAEDEVAAAKALKKIKVEYEEYPFVLDPEEAMREGAGRLHEAFENNILGHTVFTNGDFDEAIREEGLIKVEGVYETPIVQHCHIEPPVSLAYMEGGRIVIVASTQIPHIVRRVVGQALGIPWGKVRVIKPYIGGGFGNKQDALYEPLNAYLTQAVGGRPVKLEITREETFTATRVRHAMRFYMESYVRPNGRVVARSCRVFANQGAYASHGHSVVSKAMTSIRQLYSDEKAYKVEGYTVFTNTATAGAMRGYGTPQSVFAIESHAEDIARALNINALAFRRLNMMPVGYHDPYSKNTNYYDSFNQCIEKGSAYIGYEDKLKRYANQTGDVRRGVGMSLLWYNTAVWPISLEASSCRMVLNQDGSVQVQIGETEIGQGADTAFAQMTSQTLGISLGNVHIVSSQDTDVTPFGLGAYGSRQTYVGGMAIRQTAGLLKRRILEYAHKMTRMQTYLLDLRDDYIVFKESGEELLSLEAVAMEAFYSLDDAVHLTAQTTAQCKSNAYSFGCAFAEVEVDIPLGRVRLLNLVNVHDCGRLINPQLAQAQVHGGMSMAIGFGLGERLLYDAKSGKPLNGNLLDYKLSTTMDHPHLEAQFVENAEPTSAYGTKALGEPPAVPGAPAIRNAILHATGVPINEIPITPHALFPKFREAGLI